MNGHNGRIYVVVGRETIGTLTDSIGFTAAQILKRVSHAVVQAIGGDVRFTLEATAPVAATTGHRLPEDSMIKVWGQQALLNFRAIDDGGTAKLEVTYMGSGA